MTATPSNPHQQPLIHRYIDQAAWVRACSSSIVQALRTDLLSSKNVLLLVSGGSTPIPVFHALAEADLPWPRITVSLVDERVIDAGQPGRNADLLSEHLFTGAATKARFWPLLDTDIDATHAAHHASLRLASESLPISVVVLGMGDDGHTASLFPGASNLDAALANPQPYAAVDASHCPGAGNWPQRVSLTPAGLGMARRRLLLLTGMHKLTVFEQACSKYTHARKVPIRTTWETPGAALAVHWHP